MGTVHLTCDTNGSLNRPSKSFIFISYPRPITPYNLLLYFPRGDFQAGSTIKGRNMVNLYPERQESDLLSIGSHSLPIAKFPLHCSISIFKVSSDGQTHGTARKA
jgi:hypothetical protein